MVKMKEIAPCQKELEIQLPLEAVEAEYQVVYQEIKKKARVPGFRVGFAPQDLLEQHYGENAKEEVIRRLVAHGVEEALKKQPSLDLISRPRVTQVDLKPKAPMKFSAQIEVAPTVPLGRYQGLRLKKQKVEGSEAAIQKVLEHLRDSHAELKTVLEPRPAQENDFLLTDLTEVIPGKEPVKRRDVLLQLDLAKDSQGTMKQLLGMQPGTERSVTLPDGKSVTVRLKEIKAKTLSPIDDAFAKLVGPFLNLSALKEAIAKDLAKEAEYAQKRSLQSQAVEQLLDAWNFDVPPSLVVSQARRMVKDRSLELLQQGVSPEKVEEQGKLLTEQAKLDALKEVKLFFILRRVAGQEKLTASREEVDAKVAGLAARLGLQPQALRIDLESRDLLDELVWGVIRDKVFDLILQTAEIKEG